MRRPTKEDVGALIDPHTTLDFTFDGKQMTGFQGDTVASALLANGIDLVARSFKYHRPRGIVSAASEEPSALMTVRIDGLEEPNTRATQALLQDGMAVQSQNRWPSLEVDVFGVLNSASAFLPSGFYYKTFMAPSRAWPFYEWVIRHIAGLGKVPAEPPTGRYERTFAHCDVLVAGGGAAGLVAALSAGRAGARVIIAEEQSHLGLGLLPETGTIDGMKPWDWVGKVVAELTSMPNVRVLRATTVVGLYDHNMVTLAERLPALNTAEAQPRQRLWKLRPREIVLAIGSIERPVLFENNDRPGVMLASAIEAYADRFNVLAGRRAVVATSHDGGSLTALRLKKHGIDIAAVVDSRNAISADVAAALKAQDIRCVTGADVVAATGRRHVNGVRVRLRSGDVDMDIDCDLVALAGGWSPNVHLFAHTRASLGYDADLGAFVPGEAPLHVHSAGACHGVFGLADAIRDGLTAGHNAIAACGLTPADVVMPDITGGHEFQPRPPVGLPQGLNQNRVFVDLQNDVTVADIHLATRENYGAVEHLKRYTTLGMGTDQGKLGNLNGLAVLADIRGVEVGDLGTTTYRPPYTPITFASVIGGDKGEQNHPTRRNAAHRLHAEANAHWVNAGLWKRPQFYPQAGESDLEAVNREVLSVRACAGIVDVSTLGKIDVQGPDAIELLERVYMNGFRTLPVGKGRYGVMLRDDGMIFDDGVTMRIGETHFIMSTTTGQIQQVVEHLTRMLATECRNLDVFVTNVTESWFSCALAGPDARRVLKGVTEGIDLSPTALPFMGCAEGVVAGLPARLFRISFSGELSYEINVPSDCGTALWKRLLAHGADLGLKVYGVESMGVMRVEKGYFVVGREADGRVTPDDLGLGRMASKKKSYIGSAALNLPALKEPGRRQLVGLVPVAPGIKVPRGATIVEKGVHEGGAPPIGHVTSQVFSPCLGHGVALALVAGGRARMGEHLTAASPLEGGDVVVEVVDPVFIDPKGERLNE
ncbi:sarcosine oxidase subunit alpha family protein [Sneathiella sp.]|uniref:sarcosine oxidase subunit alpha family protein n=1 Tax=Sneathiella sp. TaxID=1964365 RepID=UPI0035644DA3